MFNAVVLNTGKTGLPLMSSIASDVMEMKVLLIDVATALRRFRLFKSNGVSWIVMEVLSCEVE